MAGCLRAKKVQARATGSPGLKPGRGLSSTASTENSLPRQARARSGGSSRERELGDLKEVGAGYGVLTSGHKESRCG